MSYLESDCCQRNFGPQSTLLMTAEVERMEDEEAQRCFTAVKPWQEQP